MLQQISGLISPNAIDEWVASLTALPSFLHAEHLYRPDEAAGVARLHNLRTYLAVMAERRPTTLLVGEAPGYRGTARTGIPFVSPAMLAGSVPGVVAFFEHSRIEPVEPIINLPAEVTSAAVWRTLLKAPVLPLLWAAYPHHPHRPETTLSNRTPTRIEVASGRPLVASLIELFQIEQVVALGNVAAELLTRLGIPAQKVRHPARGGATIFAEQITPLLAGADPVRLTATR